MAVLPSSCGPSASKCSPNVGARIEKADNLAGHGIEAGNVRSLVAIAVSTSQGQIAFNGLAAVFFGADVVNLKG